MRRNMLFGILIHMALVLRHGTTSRLLVNINNIVFMNR